MMLTGRNIRADKAKKMGLVHQLVDPLGTEVFLMSTKDVFVTYSLCFNGSMILSMFGITLLRSGVEESRGQNDGVP